MVKKKFFGSLVIGFSLFLASCLRNNDVEIDDWLLGNAQIASFSLSNDSIIGLADVVFTIDQVNGRIFNKDSMPHGTVIDEKVLCEMTFEVGSLGVLFVNTVTNDTVYWNGTDSIDFSAPVLITVYPYDGESTKTYEAKINIHQVNPDSMAWQLHSFLIPERTFVDMKPLAVGDRYYLYTKESATSINMLYRTTTAFDLMYWEPTSLTGFPESAVLPQITAFGDGFYVFDAEGKLYYSDDGLLWEAVDETPVIIALLGVVQDGGFQQPTVLAGIALEDETYRFVSMNAQREWTTGQDVPDNFALSGFGQIAYASMYHQYLVVASGRDKTDQLSDMTWSTMDGLSWTPLTAPSATFSKREGAALYHQGDTLYLIGGINPSGMALKDVYFSKDKGVSWMEDNIHLTPTNFEARGFASTIVDKDNFVLLFGGKAGRDRIVINELWRGRINRFGF